MAKWICVVAYMETICGPYWVPNHIFFKGKQVERCDARKKTVKHDTASAFIQLSQFLGASNLECTFRFLGCFHTRYDAQRETTFQLIQSQDPSSLIQSAHSLRIAPNDPTWRRCLLGYPWSRPQIGLRALSSRDFLQPPVEQPEQLESERRLHHFPDSWFLTTCAEMRVRVMARKASVSKILPLLSVANCPIIERSGKSDDFWKM